MEGGQIVSGEVVRKLLGQIEATREEVIDWVTENLPKLHLEKDRLMKEMDVLAKQVQEIDELMVEIGVLPSASEDGGERVLRIKYDDAEVTGVELGDRMNGILKGMVGVKGWNWEH